LLEASTRASRLRIGEDAFPCLRGVPLTLKALRKKDYSEEPQTLGEHLKKRRRELGLLQREVAARIADRYAADLLMPHYLFKPVAQNVGKLTFKAIGALADEFHTRVTSTAIRAVECDQWPAILVCHGQGGRKWFTRSPSVPKRWFPQETLDAESYAMDVLYGRKPENPHLRKIGADAWFDRREAERYEVLEQSVRTGPAEILCLISLTDPQMLEDQESWG